MAAAVGFSIYIYIRILSQTGLAGHSKALQHPEGKTIEKNQGNAHPVFAPKEKNKGKTKEKEYSLGWTWPSLLILTIHSFIC